MNYYFLKFQSFTKVTFRNQKLFEFCLLRSQQPKGVIMSVAPVKLPD